MKAITYVIAALLFLASVGMNVLFLAGEGIHIHHTYNMQQHQEQIQAQLLIGPFATRGSLRWEKWTVERMRSKGFGKGTVVDTVHAFLNSLPAEASYFCEIMVLPAKGSVVWIQSETEIIVYVPVITPDK